MVDMPSSSLIPADAMVDMSSSSLIPADAVDISNSIVRASLKYAATKLSSLSESDLSLLSDHSIFKILEAEFSSKSKDDLKLIFHAELSLLKSLKDNFLLPVFKSFFYTVGKFVVFTCIGVPSIIYINKWLAKIAPRYITITTTTSIVHQEERVKHSKRSDYLSKYSTNPDLKGLKGIGETTFKKTTLA